VPLLQDVFWVGMAITIMAGLTFGTILTMIVVPTLYAMLYRLKKPKSNEEPQPSSTAPVPAKA